MTPPAEPRRIGYVVSRFPKLSETFILREMDALEEQGWRISLFPLLAESAEVVHPAAVPWLSRSRALPMLSLSVVLANGRVLARAPRTYLGLWWAVLGGYARQPASLLRALALLPSCVHLSEVVRRDRVPQLHAHYATYPLLACWVVHQLVGTPYSVTIHAHDIFSGTPMLARKLHAASAVVAISEFNRGFLVGQVDRDLQERTTVVRCGVDVAQYAGEPAAALVDRPLRVLCVGSLQEYKGQAHLVEACRLLVAKGHAVHCVLVGGGPDEGALRRRIEESGLEGVVELAGPRPQEEVAALMRSADAYVQPSVVAADGQMEGIPVALMEALASGLPVVASGLSGVPELVRDEETGWLVEPRDSDGIAAALEDIVRRPDEAAARARAGRSLVATEYDLQRNVGTLSRLLAKVQPL